MALVNPNNNFNSIKARDLIDQSCMLIGIPPEKIGGFLIKTALFSINSILSSWANSGVIQFNETQTLIKFQNGLIRYELPDGFYDVYDFNLATLGRRRSGIPYSSAGGSPAAAFDENITTSCEQTSPNGTIGINFNWDDGPYKSDFFGVCSAKDTEYQLVLEGSNDQTNWLTLYKMDRPTKFIGFPSQLSTQWFQINQPQAFKYLQIREIGGNTLNIRELYFEQYIQSIYRSNIGRSAYMQLSARENKSSPTLYSLEKQKQNIIVNIYQAPSDLPLIQDYANEANYNNFGLMRAVKYPLTVNFLSDEIPINRLFIPALEYELAYKLALKSSRADQAQVLMGIAEMEFQKAKLSNNDLGGLKIQKPSYPS